LGDVHPQQNYRSVGIALEADPLRDRQIIAGAQKHLKGKPAEIILFHVVESVTARLMGDTVFDQEARQESQYLESLAEEIRVAGYSCHWHLAGGEPLTEIIRIAEKEKFDNIFAGSHGHGVLAKLILGSTVSRLRKKLSIPIISIPLRHKAKKK